MWRAIGASVIGASHAAAETRCQDHSVYALVATPAGDAIVLAVADGAGTAAAAYQGARAAVEAAVEHVVSGVGADRTLDAALIAESFDAAREYVLAMAAECERDPRDYASTLLLAVATADATVAGQVGDGAIVADDGALRALTWPQQGEYANATHFLVDDDALERIEIVEAGPANRIAVLSDGLQALALEYETKTPFEPFFAPFFAYLETTDKEDALVEQELRDYLGSPTVNERTDDDKSLVIAVRR